MDVSSGQQIFKLIIVNFCQDHLELAFPHAFICISLVTYHSVVKSNLKSLILEIEKVKIFLTWQFEELKNNLDGNLSET